jgi:hypothetical protein
MLEFTQSMKVSSILVWKGISDSFDVPAIRVTGFVKSIQFFKNLILTADDSII